MIKKGSASYERKTVMEVGGPLKQKKTRHQNIRNQDIASNTPCVPEGTVADIYIYVRIYSVKFYSEYIGYIVWGLY